MAYSGEVRVDTRVTTDNIKKDLAKAEREIAKISKAFDSTTASVRKQEISLADLQRKYDALMEGQKTPASLSAMQTSLRNTEREIREVEKANKDLFAQYDAAAQRAEALRPFGETDTQFIKAQEQADILFQRLEPVEQKFAELNAKAQDLRQSIAGVKMTPETSAEAQLLADKIQLTQEQLAQGQAKAAGLEQGIASATAEAERLKGALGESGGAESAKAFIDGIGQAAQTAAQISTSAFKKIGSFIGGIAAGATKAAKGVLGVAKNILTLGASSRKASGGVNGLFKRLLQLGAAAFVFNVLRKGLRELSDSMRNLLLANQEFASAWGQIRVNMITAFAPLWEVLEPAIVKFMQLLAQFTAVLAQFMALLFGKTYTQARASAKALNDQSKALKGVGGAAEKASKQLQGFDQINRLAAESGGGGAGAEGLDFEFPEPEPMDFAWLDDILNVFKTAWDNVGDYVIAGWKYALEEVWGLIKKIGATFLEVWTDGHGQRFLESLLTLLGTIGYIIGDIAKAFSKAWDIAGYDLVASFFDMLTDILDLLNAIGVAFREAWNNELGVSITTHILRIFTNINNIIGGLARKLREAWESEGNGVRIWTAILGIVDKVLGFIERITKATADWVETLDLSPLMSSIATLLEAFEKLADVILDKLGDAYENVLLPFATWLLEIGMPKALEWLAEKIEQLSEWLDVNAESFAQAAISVGKFLLVLTPILGIVGKILPLITTLSTLIPVFGSIAAVALPIIGIIAAIAAGIAIFIDGIRNGKIPMEDLITVVKGIGDIFKFVWETILKPILSTWLSLVKEVVSIIQTILGGFITFLAGVFTGDWNKAWDGIKKIFTGLWDAIILILAGLPAKLLQLGINIITGLFNGISSKVDAIKSIFTSLRDFISNIIGNIGSAISGLLDKISGAKSSASSISVGGVSGRSLGISPALFSPAIGNIEIPKLARGGIVDSATIAMIGEKGREAVVPLENNTEWMDTLAAKIAANSADNSALAAKLDILIEFMRKGLTVELDGQKVSREVTRNQRGLSQQYGVSLAR